MKSEARRACDLPARPPGCAAPQSSRSPPAPRPRQSPAPSRRLHSAGRARCRRRAQAAEAQHGKECAQEWPLHLDPAPPRPALHRSRRRTMPRRAPGWLTAVPLELLMKSVVAWALAASMSLTTTRAPCCRGEARRGERRALLMRGTLALCSPSRCLSLAGPAPEASMTRAAGPPARREWRWLRPRPAPPPSLSPPVGRGGRSASVWASSGEEAGAASQC